MPTDLEARHSVYAQALEELPKHWEGRLQQASVYRYWGRPEEVLKDMTNPLLAYTQ